MLCVCVCPRACADVWCNMRVHFLAVFRPEKPIAVKLQFIFNLFDYNMDDTLDPEELNEMLAVVSDVKRPHAHTHTHTHTHRHAHAQACTLALLLSRVVPRSRACSTPACVLSCEGNGPSAVLMHGTSACRSLEVLLQRAESVSVTENRSRPPTHPPTLSLPPSLPPSLPLTLSSHTRVPCTDQTRRRRGRAQSACRADGGMRACSGVGVGVDARECSACTR